MHADQDAPTTDPCPAPRPLAGPPQGDGGAEDDCWVPPRPILDWARRRLGAAAVAAPWSPLPGGKTNRLWRVSGADGDLIVKLYRPGMASRLFPNSAVAEARALVRLAGTGLAPALCAAGRTDLGRVLCYRAVPGTAPGGIEGTAAVARALAHLHALPAPAGFRRVSSRPHALAAGSLADLACLPPTPEAARLAAIAEGISRRHDPGVAPVLLHGDPVAGNVLVSPGGAVTLIDWQCPALGDPVHDLAIALSPGMRVLYGLAPLTGAERASFWRAYGRDDVRGRFGSLAPILSLRLAAHFLAQAARARPGYAAAAGVELAALEE